MKRYRFPIILTLLLLIFFPVFTFTITPFSFQNLPGNHISEFEVTQLTQPLHSDSASDNLPDSPWFDEDWNYRKAHVIQGSSHGMLTDYQLRFEVHRGIGTDSGPIVYCGFNCSNNFEDLRFTSADGATLFSYWIEEIITTPERVAFVWVKIPSIPAFPMNTTMFMYYGNSHVLSESDIDSTFDAACDMEEGNLSDWDGSWGLVNHTVTTTYAHTGTFSLSMTPAPGLPDSSGRYLNVSNFDDFHAYRIWFYDTGTTTTSKATNAILSDGPTDDYKVYLGCQGHLSNYSYWDGGSWEESNVTRSIGFHYFEFRHLDNTTYLYLDDQLIHTSTRLDEPQLSQFRVYVYRGYPEASFFDDLIVRKWVSSEPTHIGWFSIPPLSQWTVLVYLDGDNDLEEYAFNDLNSMETIGSTSEVRIIVYVDFWEGSDAPYTGARCYEVLQDSNLNLITSPQLSSGLPSEPNMGDWHVLRDFIVFGQTYAPAEQYLLVLWNHGAGAYGLCSDDTSDDRLTIAELNQALSDSQVQHLDIVAFDACLMGQLEVAYEIRDTADLVVFSEEGVPLTGYPYEDILLNLTTFPNTTPKALTTSMVYYYVTAYDVGGRYYDPIHNDACLSSIETVKLQTIAQNLDFLAQSMLGSISDPDIYEGVSWARQGTQSFSWASFIDLYSFAENLMVRFPGVSMVYPTALNLTLAIQDAVYEEMHLTGVSNAHGLGAVLDSYGSYQLALANDTMWDEFTEAFIDVGSDFSNALPLLANIGPPESPNLHCGYLDSAYDSVYFVFTPTETGLHSITIDTALPEYSTDFDLYIYDAYQNGLDDSLSSDSAESVSIHLNAGSTYYIEIYSYPSGSEGAGVFYLHVQTPSGPVPPNLTILFIAVTFVAIIAGVVAITFFLLRRQNMIAPPPRYTGPSYPPPHSTKTIEGAKFCAYCGAATPQGARYCPVCGASLI